MSHRFRGRLPEVQETDRDRGSAQFPDQRHLWHKQADNDDRRYDEGQFRNYRKAKQQIVEVANTSRRSFIHEFAGGQRKTWLQCLTEKSNGAHESPGQYISELAACLLCHRAEMTHRGEVSQGDDLRARRDVRGKFEVETSLSGATLSIIPRGSSSSARRRRQVQKVVAKIETVFSNRARFENIFSVPEVLRTRWDKTCAKRQGPERGPKNDGRFEHPDTVATTEARRQIQNAGRPGGVASTGSTRPLEVDPRRHIQPEGLFRALVSSWPCRC